jgi:hypothetical protein
MYNKITSTFEVPEALVDWVADKLVDRNLTVSHVDATIEGKPDKGCPQGGVLSPLLWCLVVKDFLQDLQKEGFMFKGCADDIALLVSGTLLNSHRD